MYDASGTGRSKPSIIIRNACRDSGGNGCFSSSPDRRSPIAQGSRLFLLTAQAGINELAQFDFIVLIGKRYTHERHTRRLQRLLWE